ncbi:MAG: hypothetical protein ACYDEY_04285 [Acidimicrobiales bacterium]
MTSSIWSFHFKIGPRRSLLLERQRSHPAIQQASRRWNRYQTAGILVALALGMTACSGSQGSGTAHRAAKSTGSSASPKTHLTPASTPAPSAGTGEGASWPSQQVGVYGQLTAQPLPGDFNPTRQGTVYKFVAGQEVALTGTGFPAGAPVTVLVLAPARSNSLEGKPVRAIAMVGKTGSFHATVRIPLWATGASALPGSPAGPLFFTAGSWGAGPHQISATDMEAVLPRGSSCKPK